MDLSLYQPGEATLVVRFHSTLRTYEYQLIDTVWRDPVSSDPVLENPQEKIERLVQRLNQLARGHESPPTDEVHLWLKGEGSTLWRDLIPAKIQQQFWERRDHIRRLTIISSKDAVPWELVYPRGPGPNDDAGFLVEQFPVVRWVSTHERAHHLPLARAIYVLPSGSPAAAESEIQAIHRLVGGHGVAPPTIRKAGSLLDHLKKAEFNLLHFACHNTFGADSSSVLMDDRSFPLEVLNGLAMDHPLKANAPLVFMNACRSGGKAAMYTQLGGWAESFIAAGAGAFVGSLWEVRDTTAAIFAQEFYSTLVGGGSLGDAVGKGREAIRNESGDPTWLAYSAYGDSAATIS